MLLISLSGNPGQPGDHRPPAAVPPGTQRPDHTDADPAVREGNQSFNSVQNDIIYIFFHHGNIVHTRLAW